MTEEKILDQLLRNICRAFKEEDEDELIGEIARCVGEAYNARADMLELRVVDKSIMTALHAHQALRAAFVQNSFQDELSVVSN